MNMGKLIYRKYLSIIFLVLVIIITIFVLNKAKKDVREKTNQTLVSILNSTHQTISHLWVHEYLQIIREWASNTSLVESTLKLLNSSSDRQKYLQLLKEDNVGKFLKSKIKDHNISEIFILSKDYINTRWRN